MNLCRLHYGLYLLADKDGRVPFDLAALQRKLFPNHPVPLARLINILETAGMITLEGEPLSIRLLPWPHVGQRATASKGDRLQEVTSGPAPEGVRVQSQAEISKVKRLRHKTGIIGFQHSPGYLTFLKAWGPLRRPRDMQKTAWQQWQELERQGNLPDIAVVLLALKTHPPRSNTWPSSWLKSKPWKAARTPAPKCPVCNDERIIYGTTPQGRKGAIPCPRCSN